MESSSSTSMKKQLASSFSTKQSCLPSNSTGIFSSIFPPPSKVMGRKASAAELIQSLEKQSYGCRAWNKSAPADVTKNREGGGHCTSSKEHESLFHDRGECPLSSSLFYGGQEDMYIKSSDAQKTVSTRRKEENMILTETTNIVLLEEIGGKVHFITRNMASKTQDWDSRLFSRGVTEVLEPA